MSTSDGSKPKCPFAFDLLEEYPPPTVCGGPDVPSNPPDDETMLKWIETAPNVPGLDWLRVVQYADDPKKWTVTLRWR